MSRILSLLLCFLTPSFAQQEILVPSGFDLSKDGKTLIFAWADDIWTSSADGGLAKRLTHHPAPDTNPHLSPDGKTVYFNSTRLGPNHIFSIPLTGGTPEQLTFHSEGSTLQDLHPTEPKLLILARRDHPGRTPFRLFEKPINPNQDEQLIVNADATSGKYSPNGKQILLTRGGTKPYRKGHIGPQSTRTWIYNLENKKFTEPVKHPSGCRFPIWAPDGRSFYYVTGRSGSFNIWHHHLNTKKDTQITHHLDDSVILPNLSADGNTLIYRHLFHLYQTPAPLEPSPRASTSTTTPFYPYPKSKPSRLEQPKTPPSPDPVSNGLSPSTETSTPWTPS